MSIEYNKNLFIPLIHLENFWEKKYFWLRSMKKWPKVIFHHFRLQNAFFITLSLQNAFFIFFSQKYFFSPKIFSPSKFFSPSKILQRKNISPLEIIKKSFFITSSPKVIFRTFRDYLMKNIFRLFYPPKSHISPIGQGAKKLSASKRSFTYRR